MHQLAVAILEPVALAILLAHARQAVTVVRHRQPCGRMKPVFEKLALAHQLLKHRRAIIRDARAEHVMMGALHHRYGIDLHVTDLFDCAQYRSFASTEGFGSQQALLIEGDAAEFCGE